MEDIRNNFESEETTYKLKNMIMNKILKIK